MRKGLIHLILYLRKLHKAYRITITGSNGNLSSTAWTVSTSIVLQWLRDDTIFACAILGIVDQNIIITTKY